MNKTTPIKIALPKGRLVAETAALLERAGWGLAGYTEKTRLYRLRSERFAGLSAKMFHEKDIPVQVAIGNYDLGICGLDWVEELAVKYPASPVVKARELAYGESTLCVAGYRPQKATLKQIRARKGLIRIASEYPNLAESFAARNRLRRFSVFPLWGGADVYPPENAELVLISVGREPLSPDLTVVSETLRSSACLIANRDSWERKDMAEILASLDGALARSTRRPPLEIPAQTRACAVPDTGRDVIRIALPDGHQQPPMRALLDRAGIQVSDYPSATGNRRPAVNLAGVAAKVIRPQDMPLQVANGNFDLAITGRDWLLDHLYQFPTSPVRELANLKFGWVRIVAVVSHESGIASLSDLRRATTERPVPLRVASEYVNIADKYARDNHLGRYRVIPTWGATEAFLPEDADLLIENTQTGQTIARHNLRIVDTIFESTACLIGNTGGALSESKKERLDTLIEILRAAVEEA